MRLPIGRSRLAIVALVGVPVFLLAGRLLGSQAPVEHKAQSDRIIARGRLEPAGRTHLVSGPSEGGTIAQLRVDEGSRVHAGDILAVLDRYDVAQAAVVSAQRDLDLAHLQEKQVRAGAKQSDIVAQRALLGTREAELRRARQQYDRATRLNSSGFISNDSMEDRTLAVRRGEDTLNQARAGLRAMTETRPIDEQVAGAQVGQAEAQLAAAKVTRERAIIRAPIDGAVLSLNARTGSALGAHGLLTLGDIDHMIAVGEFSEEVATKVHPGQRVLVTVRGNDKLYRGKIFRVLNDVNRTARPTSDVLEGRDARVVEAEIHFHPGEKVPAFVGAEAKVTLLLGPAGH